MYPEFLCKVIFEFLFLFFEMVIILELDSFKLVQLKLCFFTEKIN